ncbi:MAG: hypothetical protein H5T69_14825 [Chloroflexi bacterium]|nr:hypothetical protein [Chloroflexota bacterium]
MATEYRLQEIEALRDIRYHRTPERRIQSEEEALAFVNEVGFCFLFSAKGIEMPTLWAATVGSRRPLPHTHHDPDLGKVWQWKDSLPAKGALFYGKLLLGKPMLISLEWLPFFYALSPNYGDEDDYLTQYQEGLMTVEAKNVYEALLNEGAMATSRLRQAAGLPGGGANARRFERALAELQRELKIAKVGISDANRWGYAYVYDLFQRRFPDVPERARKISTDEAQSRLLLCYLHNVVAQIESAARRLFGWDEWEWQRLLQRLEDRDLIVRGVRIIGSPGRYLMDKNAFHHKPGG